MSIRERVPGDRYDPNIPPATSSIFASGGYGKGTKWRPTPNSDPKGTPGKGQDPPWAADWFGWGKGNKKRILR